MCLLLLLGQASFALPQSESLTLDTAKSKITFEITHMGVLTVEGTFHHFAGEAVMGKNDMKSLKGRIAVASIDTEDATRDETLLTEAYLDAKAFPFIYFTSTRISPRSVMGKLTIKGVESPIILTYEKKKKGDELRLIRMSVTLDRKDFQLDFGPMDALIGDEIQVMLELILSSE